MALVLDLAPADRTAIIRDRLRAERRAQVPHLLDVEVTSAVRRHILSGQYGPRRGRQALDRLGELPLVRWTHTPLLGRALALRDQLTAYDAVYVALAEALGATLLTRDRRLARAGGHRAAVELV
ncbi:MAG TPA: type II toxin-antitoxin system VapC family toxin [Actinomycetes bacterium]|nr:type II toxin-antitoxin system VapC family toxin [Actinomycetes bacterium]